MMRRRHHRAWAGIAAISLSLAAMPATAEDPANGAIGDQRPLEAPALPGGPLDNDGLDNMVLRRTVTALGDRFRYRAGVARDDGQTGRHGLVEDDPVPLVLRGNGQDVVFAERRGERIVVDPAGELHATLQPVVGNAIMTPRDVAFVGRLADNGEFGVAVGGR